MYIGTSVATEEQYANFLALDAGDNPLLQVRPTWDELVAQGKVEDGKVAIMVYPEHISYTRPSDLDAMHESGELQVVEDVYSTGVLFGMPGWGTEGTELIEDLKGYRKKIDRALELLQVPGVQLENWDYNCHDGGTVVLRFETTDEAVARKYNFDEVLRAGAEDFEDAPWTTAVAE
jgi:hypothetical protein